MQALTLSRSAALGDIVGLLVLAPTILPRLPRPRTLLLALGVPTAALLLLYSSSSFVRTVISSRTNVNGSGVQTHFEFYSLVGPALDPHPLFGMGYNTFAVFYQFLTGKSDFGPHSFWVATLVETGVVGLALYLGFFAWVTRLRAWPCDTPPTPTAGCWPTVWWPPWPAPWPRTSST